MILLAVNTKRPTLQGAEAWVQSPEGDSRLFDLIITMHRKKVQLSSPSKPHHISLATGNRSSGLWCISEKWKVELESLYNPSSTRAMTSRWISLVPSPMVHSRWSR